MRAVAAPVRAGHQALELPRSRAPAIFRNDGQPGHLQQAFQVVGVRRPAKGLHLLDPPALFGLRTAVGSARVGCAADGHFFGTSAADPIVSGSGVSQEEATPVLEQPSFMRSKLWAVRPPSAPTE